MEQFSLDKWLQDKSRKVVTRDGRPVRIVCYDMKSVSPIIGVILHRLGGEFERNYATNGRFSTQNESEYDLFFADEEDDEFMLNSFLHKLEVCDLLSNKEITWIKNKLKSIKQWKPSEKQMDELEYVTRGNSYPQLTSLYQDLKNLI
jgi:hypothetical protein